jgi:adenine-specific DNA-methyltransferase
MTDKIDGLSKDLEAEACEKLKSIFPDCFVEGKLDIDKLLNLCGEYINDDFECYNFTWKGKAECLQLAQKRSSGTLRPCPEESVNFDATQNLYIEGDNLEVLKLLQNSYHRKVKMIYIDPPYNTGHDFVYDDDFKDPVAHYKEIIGQATKSNPETMGRFHTNWLNMMYPRLRLAANLLRDDGIICISIDDNEVHNLRKLCDEAFGEENFIACLVWEKGRKNDARLFSVGHEYMLVYAKSLSCLREIKTIWREKKPGTKEIWEKYIELRRKYNKDNVLIEKDLQAWFASLPDKHPSKKWSRYKRVDNTGPWRDRDISWPGGGGPRYDVPHPKTGKPCRVPEGGWRYSSSEEMQRQIALGSVEFRTDDSEPPFRKAHIRPVQADENSDSGFDEEADDAESGLATQVRGSYFYKQSQVAIKYFRSLMDGKLFDNPKDHIELARLFGYICGDASDAIILDFFSGSGATAQAVMELNAEGGGNRRFICVQLPEQCDDKSVALKTGYQNICEIGKERIRRAGRQIQDDLSKQAPRLDFEGQAAEPLDTGFKVFKLDTSNLKQWDSSPIHDRSLLEFELRLNEMMDSVKPDRTELDMIYEVMLKIGRPLTETVTPREFDGKKAYCIREDNLLVICLAKDISQEAVKQMAALAPARLIFGQECFADMSALSNAKLYLRNLEMPFQFIL